MSVGSNQDSFKAHVDAILPKTLSTQPFKTHEDLGSLITGFIAGITGLNQDESVQAEVMQRIYETGRAAVIERISVPENDVYKAWEASKPYSDSKSYRGIIFDMLGQEVAIAAQQHRDASRGGPDQNGRPENGHYPRSRF